MHGKGEREASTNLLFASCMDAMAELMELVGSSGWTEGSTAKTTGREGRATDAHELLTLSCDDGRARLVRTAEYGIRGQSEARAGDRVCELSVLLGGGGEHLGVPLL